MTAGSYGGSAGVPSITVDAKGRVTGISNGGFVYPQKVFEAYLLTSQAMSANMAATQLTAWDTPVGTVIGTWSSNTWIPNFGGTYLISLRVVIAPGGNNNLMGQAGVKSNGTIIAQGPITFIPAAVSNASSVTANTNFPAEVTWCGTINSSTSVTFFGKISTGNTGSTAGTASGVSTAGTSDDTKTHVVIWRLN